MLQNPVICFDLGRAQITYLSMEVSIISVPGLHDTFLFWKMGIGSNPLGVNSCMLIGLHPSFYSDLKSYVG
jgi:hypothetical protein